MTIKLLTTTACPKCPIVKEMLDSAKLVYSTLVDEDAIRLAKELNISTVPTVISESGKIFTGINEIQHFIDEKFKEMRDSEGNIIA